MKIPIDILVKLSMVDQAIRAIDEQLRETGEVVQGWGGTAEELRAALDNGSLRTSMLNEVVGRDVLRRVKESIYPTPARLKDILARLKDIFSEPPFAKDE